MPAFQPFFLYSRCLLAAGLRDNKSGAIVGDIEGKYVDPKNGIAFTQTWTSKNQLKSLLELENQIAKGVLDKDW